MIKFFRTTFIAILFIAGIAMFRTGTAEAWYGDYSYDPYYGYYGYGAGGTSIYPWNTAYVEGYDQYAYSFSRRDYRNDYYRPRVSGYDPYVWEDRRYSRRYENRYDRYDYDYDYYDYEYSDNYRRYDRYRY